MPGTRPVLAVGVISTRPDHAPRFVIEARLSTGEAEQAEGATKRAAEHAAAAALLGRLE